MTKSQIVLPTCLIACLVFAAAAQAQEMSGLLVGSWKADVEQTLQAMQEADSPQDPEMARQVLPGASVHFADGGKLTMAMEMGGIQQENHATWEVAATDEQQKTITITVTMEEVPDQSNSAEITLLSDDTIRLATDDGNVMVLNRMEAGDGD